MYGLINVKIQILIKPFSQAMGFPIIIEHKLQDCIQFPMHINIKKTKELLRRVNITKSACF